MALVTFGQIETVKIPGQKHRRRVAFDVPVSLNSKLFLVIPAGFESDGMSFPVWQLTWDDRWHERYVGPALLHDRMLDLREQGLLDLPKWAIDWMFEGALRSQGVSALETWIFTNAVRAKKG